MTLLSFTLIPDSDLILFAALLEVSTTCSLTAQQRVKTTEEKYDESRQYAPVEQVLHGTASRL